MLDEYMSRFDWNTGKPNGDLVEVFYPHEHELAEDFQKLITIIDKECKENYKIQKKIGDQGHIYIFIQ